MSEGVSVGECELGCVWVWVSEGVGECECRGGCELGCVWVSVGEGE